MMIRTSLSPSDVTPAAYLLPSAMSFSRRAATRGSTTPMRMPLLIAMRRLPSGVSSTASPGFTWASWRGSAQVGQEGEAGLAGLLDEDRHRGLAALGGRDRLLAGGDEEHLEPVDVALGDAVGRVERERGLVVLACRAELAELPEGLGKAVLGLGVGPQLEELLVRLGRVGPLRVRSLGDGLLGQLALLAGQVDRRLGGRLDIGEGHEWDRPFGSGSARVGADRSADAGQGGSMRLSGLRTASLSSTHPGCASNVASQRPGARCSPGER